MASGTGNLPNPSMSFSPFAILTAEEVNNLVENIESLATGSGIGDASVKASNVDFATFPDQKVENDLSGVTITTGTTPISTITIPNTGLWYLDGSIRVSGNTYLVSWFVIDNGSNLNHTQYYPGNTGFNSPIVKPLLKVLNVGQKVYFFVQGSSSNTTQANNIEYNFFRATRIY